MSRRRTALPRPFVTANFAITADGKISTRNHTPSDFSSPRDKRRLVEIRATCDAVLVGARTLAADTMTLGIPGIVGKRAPIRVIVSRSGRIDPSLRVFRKPGAPIVIFTTRRMAVVTRHALAEVADVFVQQSENLNLARALAVLREDYGVQRLVCEGGGELLRSFAEADLLDEIHLTICPRIFGGRKAPTVTGVPSTYLPASVALKLVEALPVDGECFTRWKVVRARTRLAKSPR
jgi:riboflavin-specific deaminase-like protein